MFLSLSEMYQENFIFNRKASINAEHSAWHWRVHFWGRKGQRWHLRADWTWVHLHSPYWRTGAKAVVESELGAGVLYLGNESLEQSFSRLVTKVLKVLWTKFYGGNACGAKRIIWLFASIKSLSFKVKMKAYRAVVVMPTHVMVTRPKSGALKFSDLAQAALAYQLCSLSSGPVAHL